MKDSVLLENQKDLLLKRSLHTIRILKENEQAANEPIAVIGMACRFPGGCSTPEKFWNFLKEKGDGVTEVPRERWDVNEFYDPNPGTPGKMYIRQAGFLKEDIREFDARFFRISPLEASEMDPQQRLLLEVSWEAIERAGQNMDNLKDSNTGVFIGIIGSEYSKLPRDNAKVNPYKATGSLSSIASGRISHILGFHGPAISVDTTCSSSLVSLHLACEALKKRTCDMALAGGVNIMVSPNAMIGLCMMNALSEDGRCRPFDADGKGYGRGEGCAVVVLKRLSTALKDGDPILALIRNTTVNHDGSSSGLTVPNGNAQKALINHALAGAGISGEDVNYLEAHGTGTSLGDPIEIKAVAESLGKKRSPENPLIIGSVKGNVGHLEGAAGICSLVKVILCLQHKKIPPNINLDTLNPGLHLEKIPAYIPLELTKPWQPFNGKSRIAGISSFGFSGTNGHVILSEYLETQKKDAVSLEMPLLSMMTLSAKSKNALSRLVRSYQAYLEANPGLNIHDLCYTANACRSHFSHRLAFIARDITQIRCLLDTFVDGQKSDSIFKGNMEKETCPKIAFLFMANRDNLSAITQEFYDTLPGFREKIEHCASLFEPYLKCSILKWLYPLDTQPLSYPEKVKEACLFSIEYTLSSLFQSWGILPDAVWAQETGKYAAACSAGIFSLETAILLVSHQWDHMTDNKRFNSPQCRVIDAHSGAPVKKKELMNPAYWQQSFYVDSSTGQEKVISELTAQGYGVFLIFGQNSEPVIHPDEQRRIFQIQNSWEQLVQILVHLYCSGVHIQWTAFYRGHQPEKILLPTYPFERKPYWSPFLPTVQSAVKETAIYPCESAINPLEGKRIHSPLNKNRFEYCYHMSLENFPELNDTHGVFHVGYCQEILSRAIKQSFPDTPSYVVKETDFISALMLSEEHTTTVHLILAPDKGSEIIFFEFYSRSQDSDQWDLNIKGTIELKRKYERFNQSPEFFEEIKKRCPENDSGLIFYHHLQKRGIQLGPSVQWVEEIWYGEGEAFARFRKASSEEKKAHQYALHIHPGIFDSCAQIFHAALWKDTPNDMRFMVVKWIDFAYPLDHKDEKELWCHVVLDRNACQPGFIIGRFDLFDQEGRLIAASRENQMQGIRGYKLKELKKIRDKAKSQEKGVNKKVINTLKSASKEQKTSILTEHFQKIVSAILDMPLADIHVEDSLRDMGMDSMTGLQLKTTIEHELDIDIPIEDIIQGLSISELISRSLESDPSRDEAPLKSQKKSLTADTTINDGWFVHRKINPQAEVRLFCLPYGGGGASLYRQWQDAFLHEHVEICPIQLPGRENRLKESLIYNISEMVDTLEAVIQPELDRPYALYGHSMGALIAFRLAYQLWQNSEIKPVHLFVGGFSSPLIYPNPLMEKILSRYREAGLTQIPNPDEINASSIEKVKKAVRNLFKIENDDLLETSLPIFISDTKIVESYKPEEEKIFDIPITAFHGSHDDRVSKEEMELWKKLTSSSFNLYILPGDHFFLHKDQSQQKLQKMIYEIIKGEKIAETRQK